MGDKKSKWFHVKPILNKKNGQMNISLPKKKMNKDMLDLIKGNSKLKINFKLEGVSL